MAERERGKQAIFPLANLNSHARSWMLFCLCSRLSNIKRTLSQFPIRSSSRLTRGRLISIIPVARQLFAKVGNERLCRLDDCLFYADCYVYADSDVLLMRSDNVSAPECLTWFTRSAGPLEVFKRIGLLFRYVHLFTFRGRIWGKVFQSIELAAWEIRHVFNQNWYSEKFQNVYPSDW